MVVGQSYFTAENSPLFPDDIGKQGRIDHKSTENSSIETGRALGKWSLCWKVSVKCMGGCTLLQNWVLRLAGLSLNSCTSHSSLGGGCKVLSTSRTAELCYSYARNFAILREFRWAARPEGKACKTRAVWTDRSLFRPEVGKTVSKAFQ